MKLKVKGHYVWVNRDKVNACLPSVEKDGTQIVGQCELVFDNGGIVADEPWGDVVRKLEDLSL